MTRDKRFLSYECFFREYMRLKTPHTAVILIIGG
jgi:hypothetical protein